MAKTSDLFKKIGDTEGTFYARRLIKDRSGKDIKEAKEMEEAARIHRTIQKKS